MRQSATDPTCHPPTTPPPQSAHRKALDILTSLGLSDSLLRVIEKRARLDKIIAYGGMALTVLIVVLLYWWLKT